MSLISAGKAPGGLTDVIRYTSYRRIVMLAAPLMLSQMGVMLMQIVDGIFLSRYSESAIAAVGPAGMTFWMLCGLFIGMIGYTGTFVAQYMGAGRPERVAASLWQGLYLAVITGAILAATSLISRPMFLRIGHEAAIMEQEIIYFNILAWGGVTFLISAALSGFYAGRNDNVTLMIAHIAGGLTNAILSILLIFGRCGFPEMGIAGAALSTVLAHVLQVSILAFLLFQRRIKQEFAIWRARAIDLLLMRRIVQHGLPNGVRFIIEIAAWTVFLLILGRIDTRGLAASNIAWRINGLAFFPVIGLSIAVSTLVGQAQGARRPDLSRKVTYRGLLIGQIWMVSIALVMVLFPDALLTMFFPAAPSAEQEAVRLMCVTLLRFVAAYCLLDNFNIIFMAMLAGAGDTRWMVITSGLLHAGFILVLLLLAHWHAHTYTFWTAASIFVCAVTLVWTYRFRSGAWQSKTVIEVTPPGDLRGPPYPESSVGIL